MVSLVRNRAHKGIDQKLAFCQGAPKAAQGANLFRRSGLTVATAGRQAMVGSPATNSAKGGLGASSRSGGKAASLQASR